MEREEFLARQGEIYEKLSKPFPPEALQHASRDMTSKKYDMTGVSHQYLIDRMNEVLGIGHWNISDIKETIRTGEPWVSGKAKADIHVSLKVQIGTWKTHIENNLATNYFEVWAERPGNGGRNLYSFDDVGVTMKAAITNATKKALSLFGVGGEAWRGTLDEDFEFDKKTGEFLKERTDRRKDDDKKQPHESLEQEGPKSQQPEESKGENGDDSLSDAQRKTLFALGTTLGMVDGNDYSRLVAACQHYYPKIRGIKSITKEQATVLIGKMKASIEKKASETAAANRKTEASKKVWKCSSCTGPVDDNQRGKTLSEFNSILCFACEEIIRNHSRRQ